MTIEPFQNLVIGSGVAGKIIAWTLAKQGQATVVVERAMVGGSCPNVACLPSKNVICSAKAVSLVHPTKGLGVVTGSAHVDMAGVARRKRQMVDGLVGCQVKPISSRRSSTKATPCRPKILACVTFLPFAIRYSGASVTICIAINCTLGQK